MQGVGFQDPEECLLPLLEAKLGVLRECAVDVTCNDVVRFLLANADLQQRIVATVLRELLHIGVLHIQRLAQ